jgi:hypothetical protein
MSNESARTLRRRGWRVMGVGVAATALVVSWPTGPTASAGTATASGPRTLSAAVGNTFGGVSQQGNPVVVDLNSTRRKVVRIVGAMDLTCTSGASGTLTDKYTDISVSRRGKFSVAFGPVTQRNDDGTTTDVQVRVTGALNDTKTRLSGTWRIILTDHDAAGALTDTCDSGLVSWKAKN